MKTEKSLKGNGKRNKIKPNKIKPNKTEQTKNRLDTYKRKGRRKLGPVCA